MKHCPRCRQEYEDASVVCADCEGEVPLDVGPRPVGPDIDEVDPALNHVLVRLELPGALALVARLEECGIAAAVGAAETALVDDHWKTGGIRHQVMIAETELERASTVWLGFMAERSPPADPGRGASPVRGAAGDRAMNLLDRICAVPAFALGLAFLLLGGIGLFAGCKANFSLPPVLGGLPALVGWGILRPIWIAWRVRREDRK